MYKSIPFDVEPNSSVAASKPGPAVARGQHFAPDKVLGDAVNEKVSFNPVLATAKIEYRINV